MKYEDLYSKGVYNKPTEGYGGVLDYATKPAEQDMSDVYKPNQSYSEPPPSFQVTDTGSKIRSGGILDSFASAPSMTASGSEPLSDQFQGTKEGDSNDWPEYGGNMANEILNTAKWDGTGNRDYTKLAQDLYDDANEKLTRDYKSIQHSEYADKLGSLMEVTAADKQILDYYYEYGIGGSDMNNDPFSLPNLIRQKDIQIRQFSPDIDLENPGAGDSSFDYASYLSAGGSPIASYENKEEGEVEATPDPDWFMQG